jgi:hypothetical protein
LLGAPSWNEALSNSLRDLREDRGLDQTLNLELRARYRVFEFEASQDGDPEVAHLFAELRRSEAEQIAQLMAGLQSRLGGMDLAALSESSR